MKLRKVLGIDVGGSGIKGAIVDTKSGNFITEKIRIPTPSSGTPKQIAELVGQIAKQHDWKVTNWNWFSCSCSKWHCKNCCQY